MRIGIDLGESHIGVGIVNENGEVICKRERDILPENKQNNQETIDKFIEYNIIYLIEKVLLANDIKISDIDLIGIASPGIVKFGVISKARNLNINKFNIIETLKKYFKVKIILRNDAKCAALAEKTYGNLKGYSDSILLTIGTGIGGAVFLNGMLLESKRYAGFELGHMVINKNGRKCTCGRKGCFETYSSITALKNDVKRKLVINENISGKQLLEIIQENKEKLSGIIVEYIENFTVGLANLINIFEPEAIAIGGSFAYYEDLFLEPIKENLRKKDTIFNKEVYPKILIAKLKNDSGIIGSTII